MVFDRKKVGNRSLVDVTITILGLVAGLMYIVSGINLMRFRQRTQGLIPWALISYILFLIPFSIYGLFNISIVLTATEMLSTIGTYIIPDRVIVETSILKFLFNQPQVLQFIVGTIVFFIAIPLLFFKIFKVKKYYIAE